MKVYFQDRTGRLHKVIGSGEPGDRRLDCPDSIVPGWCAFISESDVIPEDEYCKRCFPLGNKDNVG